MSNQVTNGEHWRDGEKGKTMHNPIFDFIEEGMPSEWIARNMGFEVQFAFGLDWLSDDDDEEFEKYGRNPDKWLENWDPGEADGFAIVSKFDTEDGPCAMYVKPVTYFAKALLEFGFTEAAQEAAKMGDIPTQVVRQHGRADTQI